MTPISDAWSWTYKLSTRLRQNAIYMSVPLGMVVAAYLSGRLRHSEAQYLARQPLSSLTYPTTDVRAPLALRAHVI